MAERTPIPTVPLALGLGGLLPFGLLAILSTGVAEGLGAPAGVARAALGLYGAVIASFLGGIRWGVALREEGAAATRDLALSVAPSLLACAAFLLPGRLALAGLALLIGVWGFVDQDLPRRELAPPWFGRLRAILSAGAAGALGLGAVV